MRFALSTLVAIVTLASGIFVSYSAFGTPAFLMLVPMTLGFLSGKVFAGTTRACVSSSVCACFGALYGAICGGLLVGSIGVYIGACAGTLTGAVVGTDIGRGL